MHIWNPQPFICKPWGRDTLFQWAVRVKYGTTQKKKKKNPKFSKQMSELFLQNKEGSRQKLPEGVH